MYLAKPTDSYEGSYEYHLKKIVEVYDFEWKRKSPALESMCRTMGYSIEELKEKFYLAVCLHDLGKLSESFQEQMRDQIAKRRPKYFRHELLSVYYMIYIMQQCITGNSEIPYYLFAVLAHHKKIDGNYRYFKREREHRIEEWPSLKKEEFEYGLNFISLGRISELDINRTFNEKLNRNIKENLFKILDKYIEESRFNKNKISKEKSRALYAICKGMLQYCDWVASSEKEPLKQEMTNLMLKEKIKAKVEGEKRMYEERTFQKQCEEEQGNVLAIAPTGSGKTEASLFWATNLKGSSIVFLMPTTITSNSIFSRFRENYFKGSHCGLTHSTAENYLKGSEDENPIERYDLLRYKAFLMPVMVSTVDQMLTTGFNVGYWALKEYAMIGASIVIDEIQAYDTYTVALITEMLRKSVAYGARFMIMSATMPKYLRDHFQQKFKLSSIVSEENMDRRRNYWKYIDEPLESIKSKIFNYIQSGKKIAVIVNDIKTAKSLYKEILKNEDVAESFDNSRVLCIHSEFTMEDRRKKEYDLEHTDKYKVVISTQVMEISLDVSFEVIFSECAPIDSLVQRAGRCNRKNEDKDSEFIVFDPSETSVKYVYKNSREVLEKTKNLLVKNQGRLSEWEIADMVDKVYSDFILEDENYREGIETYKNIVEKYTVFDIAYDEEKVFTRIFEQIKISIIPYIYKEKVIELFQKKEYALIQNYEVSVSISNYRKYIQINYCKNDYNLPIYTIDYDSNVGIKYSDESFQFC